MDWFLTAGCLELPGSSGSDSTGSVNTTGSGASSQQLSALVESHEQAVLSGDVRVTQTLNQSVERDRQNSSIAQRTVVVGSVNGTAYQDRTITNQSRVGHPVRAYWLSADNLQSVELTFEYNETAVPGGNESALIVVSESFETPLLDRLENSTVDETQNSVSVTLSDQSLLERWQGEQFFVIQWNKYLETVQNRPP